MQLSKLVTAVASFSCAVSSALSSHVRDASIMDSELLLGIRNGTSGVVAEKMSTKQFRELANASPGGVSAIWCAFMPRLTHTLWHRYTCAVTYTGGVNACSKPYTFGLL
jgi:hypothetical protein